MNHMPTNYYEQLEVINRKLSEGMAKYAPGSDNAKWKNNLLKSLEQIKKIQASDAVVKLGSGRGDFPFVGMVNQVKKSGNEETRAKACSTLREMNELLCGGIATPTDMKVCDGIVNAIKSMACRYTD